MHDLAEKRREKSIQNQQAAEKYITEEHLENCRSKVAAITGALGTAKYELLGPLRPSTGLTCLRTGPMDFVNDNSFTVVYAAPVRLASGFAGIVRPRGNSFFWCRFRISDGKVTIEQYSIGDSAHRVVAGMCRLRTR